MIPAIIAITFAYLLFGFVITASPIGQAACTGKDGGCPPLLLLLGWPLLVPIFLASISCQRINQWLKDNLLR